LQNKNTPASNSLSEVLITPNTEKSKTATVRKRALNYKAQEVTRDLFRSENNAGKTSKTHVSRSTSTGKKKPTVCQPTPKKIGFGKYAKLNSWVICVLCCSPGWMRIVLGSHLRTRRSLFVRTIHLVL
jgi:hypothetical protein